MPSTLQVEDSVGNCFLFFNTELRENPEEKLPVLQRRRHEAFLLKGIRHLSQSYDCLDASLPWLCYWILHSLELLETPLPEKLPSAIAQFLGMQGQKFHSRRRILDLDDKLCSFYSACSSLKKIIKINCH